MKKSGQGDGEEEEEKRREDMRKKGGVKYVSSKVAGNEKLKFSKEQALQNGRQVKSDQPY